MDCIYIWPISKTSYLVLHVYGDKGEFRTVHLVHDAELQEYVRWPWPTEYCRGGEEEHKYWRVWKLIGPDNEVRTTTYAVKSKYAWIALAGRRDVAMLLHSDRRPIILQGPHAWLTDRMHKFCGLYVGVWDPWSSKYLHHVVWRCQYRSILDVCDTPMEKERPYICGIKMGRDYYTVFKHPDRVQYLFYNNLWRQVAGPIAVPLSAGVGMAGHYVLPMAEVQAVFIGSSELAYLDEIEWTVADIKA